MSFWNYVRAKKKRVCSPADNKKKKKKLQGASYYSRTSDVATKNHLSRQSLWQDIGKTWYQTDKWGFLADVKESRVWWGQRYAHDQQGNVIKVSEWRQIDVRGRSRVRERARLLLHFDRLYMSVPHWCHRQSSSLPMPGIRGPWKGTRFWGGREAWMGWLAKHKTEQKPHEMSKLSLPKWYTC